jgi:hypothetical protein
MRRIVAGFVSGVFLLALLALTGSPASGATVTQYGNEASFLAVLGVTSPTQNFDGFDGEVLPCLDQSDAFCEITPPYGCATISGVSFWSSCANATTGGYVRIQAVASTDAVSSPNQLEGGYVEDPDGFPVTPQVVVMSFDTPVSAAGFFLTGLTTTVHSALVTVTFDDDTTQTFSVGILAGSETNRKFFGLTSDAKIVQIKIESGSIVNSSGEFQTTVPDLFGIDNLSFAVNPTGQVTELPEGPLVNQVLCSGDGILFEVSNPYIPGGTAVCLSNLYGPSEPTLPPGYQPSPPDDPFPCRVLTIDSPISGPTDMVYKKDGDFDSHLRLLYSELTDGVYPPFRDVTESVRKIGTINPDPTRLGGKVQWTPVKVTCAILDGPECLCSHSSDYCNGDERATLIYAGAPELCDSMDNNCNGTITDDGAGDPAVDETCTVADQMGACAQGRTACEFGNVVCKQTVDPVIEVCDGKDNDCNGLTDENHVFGGYLPPVNQDGSSIFKWKRTIPFKFQLTTCAGVFVASERPRISVFFYTSGVVGSDVEDVGSSGNANTDNLYRYDPTAKQYIYNLDTKSLAPGNSYLVRTTLDDGSTHDVVMSIRR